MKKIFYLLLIVFLLGGAANSASASFGVSPPYVKNNTLTRNSVYEQKVTLVRGNPDIDLQAEVTWDVPNANSWIEVDKGTKFILPTGEQKIPINVKITVPGNAPFANYSGALRVKTYPINPEDREGGSVSIALGARIDVDFNVVDKEIFDFEIRRIQVSDLNQYTTWGWLTFPGKIKFVMNVSNKGNVPVAPDRVEFDIYDIKGETLLEKTKNTNKLKEVHPFKGEDVIAEIPTRLPSGSYLATYRIYDHSGEVIKQEGEVNLSILPEGTLPTDTAYGFLGLSFSDKMTLIGPALLVLAGLFINFREKLTPLAQKAIKTWRKTA